MEPRLVLGTLAALAAVGVFLAALRYKARFDALRGGLRPNDGSDILRFEIELEVAEPVAPAPFAHGAVILRRITGSTPGTMLSDLSRCLGLRVAQTAGSPVDELRCDMGFMGSRLTRGTGPDMLAGSFTSSPPGDWIVGKVFFSDGEGEVFLAVNPVERRGEFLAKDPEFSEAVVREFGRVL